MLNRFDNEYMDHAENISIIVGRLYDTAQKSIQRTMADCFADGASGEEYFNQEEFLQAWQSVGPEMTRILLDVAEQTADKAVQHYLRLVSADDTPGGL